MQEQKVGITRISEAVRRQNSDIIKSNRLERGNKDRMQVKLVRTIKIEGTAREEKRKITRRREQKQREKGKRKSQIAGNEK